MGDGDRGITQRLGEHLAWSVQHRAGNKRRDPVLATPEGCPPTSTCRFCCGKKQLSSQRHTRYDIFRRNMSDHGLVAYILVSPEYKLLMRKPFSNNRAERVVNQGCSKYAGGNISEAGVTSRWGNLSYKMITFLALGGTCK